MGLFGFGNSASTDLTVCRSAFTGETHTSCTIKQATMSHCVKGSLFVQKSRVYVLEMELLEAPGQKDLMINVETEPKFTNIK
jgi:hypothetical protein